jgi:hypothetical protein
MNRTAAPARTLMFSNSRGLAVSVYPDSDKSAWYVDGTDGVVFSAARRCRGWKRRTAGTGPTDLGGQQAFGLTPPVCGRQAGDE